MDLFRRSLTGAAVSGVLACFASIFPADAAEPPVGEFKVGTIWKGGARFANDGAFTRCGMDAQFPEGLTLYFGLDAKGSLVLDFLGPDDMAASNTKVPVTFGVDGRTLATVAMEVDDESLMVMEELWLFGDLGPTSTYLSVLKKSKFLTVTVPGRTKDQAQNKTWTYTAALTGSAEAFQALESCVAKHAGNSKPAAAPAPGAAPMPAPAAPVDAAGPVGEFKIGTIWKGAARFGSAGDFMRCGMAAKFPEGLELFFTLDTKGVLGFDLYGPDDMDIPDGKAPVTLSVDGRVLRALAMNVDEDAFEFEELWLYTDLKPAADYLPAFKSGKTIAVAIQGRTMDKPPRDKTWSYTAALTGSAEAFQALEACVAKHAGSSQPAAAPAASGAASGVAPAPGATKGSTGAGKKVSFGAIAVGEDGNDLITGISSNHPSMDAAMMAAVDICQRDGGFCQVRATMDRATPCGAVAGGDDSGGGPVYGWGTGKTKAEAELGAMEACSADAFGCRVTLSRCLTE
ncbi:MAG: DUF4189 domain-containing protein [Alphaproteobacteria bacterium]